MVSKTNTKNKSNGVREQEKSEENHEQMVLVRDEASQAMIIVDAKKVSTVNKASKLSPGVTVMWQHSARERWRGSVLAIG